MARESSINDFGLLIAYVLPGFTALWGLSSLTGSPAPWLGGSPADAPSVGGFLYMTVASIAAGLTVSAVRWLAIDTLYHRTGIRPPPWDFSLLRESAAAFGIVVEHYYRYFQFYANMLVSLSLVFVARRWSLGLLSGPFGPTDAGLLAVMAVFVVGSRDSLRRYYNRGGQLLRRRPAARGRSRRGGTSVQRAGDSDESAA